MPRRATYHPLRRVALGLLLVCAWAATGQTTPAAGHGLPENIRSAQAIEHPEAVELGRELGLGNAETLAPDPSQPLTVATYEEFRFRYTAGPMAIEQGGHIRFAMRHVFHWSPPQTDDPARAGYVTVEGPEGVELEIVPWPARSDGWDLFLATFPWQHAIELRVVSGSLERGDSVTLVYGDTGAGGRGARIQPSQEEAFAFRVYVAPHADSASLPLAQDLTFSIVGGPAERVSLVAPSNARPGEQIDLTVRVEDRFGNEATGFSGPVTISGPDNASDWQGQMRPSDGGVLAAAVETGQEENDAVYRVAAGPFTANSNPVRISRRGGPTQVFWGDIHGHTLVSDGRGTVADFYAYCRDVAALDFCAVTDHGAMVTDRGWEQSKRVTERFNEAGRFVTIQAYEWSGLTEVGGDHNIYFRDSDPPIFRSKSYYDRRNQQAHHGDDRKIDFIVELHDHLKELYEEGDVLSIPHYGGRPANPQWHDPKIQRLIEIFSEHQRSHEWAYEFLRRGYRLGIIASSDNHTGRPGYGFLQNPLLASAGVLEVGSGVVAVYAEELSRDAIFDALYARHAYATTGDRILLDVRAGDAVMGSEIAGPEMPALEVDVMGTSQIRTVEILRDAAVVHMAAFDDGSATLVWQDPSPPPAGRSAAYWIRVVQDNDEEAVSSPIWWTNEATSSQP